MNKNKERKNQLFADIRMFKEGFSIWKIDILIPEIYAFTRKNLVSFIFNNVYLCYRLIG